MKFQAHGRKWNDPTYKTKICKFGLSEVFSAVKCDKKFVKCICCLINALNFFECYVNKDTTTRVIYMKKYI